MTTSLNLSKPSGNCQLENVRQETANSKKTAFQKPTPSIRQKTVTAKSASTVPKKISSATVQHSDHEDEEDETEDIHPALLKQTRKSGSLNL